MQMTFPAVNSGISHRAEISRPSVALITAGHLVGGIVVAIAVGSAIDALIGRYWFIGGRTLAAVAALTIFFFAARMWGRRISEITGIGDPQQAGSRRVLLPP